MPHIHEGKIHETAARGTTVIFRRRDQLPAKPGPLAVRIDRQQSKVTSLPAQLDVHTTGQPVSLRSGSRICRSVSLEKQKESPFLKQRGDFFRVCPIAINKKPLRAEGGVDEARDLSRVTRFGKAYLRGILHSADSDSNLGDVV